MPKRVEEASMRDLNIDELESVYGAGGKGCGSSPTPPSKGSKAKHSGSKAKHSKSRQHGSKGYC
jgi:hypothetical protein